MRSITAFSILAALAGQFVEAAPLEPRAPPSSIVPVPSIIPVGQSLGGWTSIGCYQDTYNGNAQILTHYQYQPLMTFTTCSAFCTLGGYSYMGMSNGVWCYCDNQINLYNGQGYATTADKCNVAAAGDPLINGGGYWTNAMFATNARYAADQAAASSASKSSSAAAYSASSAAAYSASSAAAYSAQSAAAYSASSAAGVLAAQSAAAYSAAQSVAAYSARVSASAYSAAQSAAAYSAGVYSAQSAAAYSASSAAAAAAQSVAAYSAAQSAAAYSAAQSAAAYSASSAAAAAQSAAAYSAAQSAAAYSASSAAGAAAAQSAAAYSASSAAAYSASSAAAAAGQSAAAYSAGIYSASSAAAYSASSAAAYSASSAAAAAAATSVPSPWVAASASCVAEGTTGRALTGASTAADNMTYGQCLNFCQSKGFGIAGLEYARECYCGDSFVNGASLTQTSSNCNMPCAGSSATTCGGPGALTVFVIPSQITSLNSDLTAAPASLPSGWTQAATPCVAEGTTGRALTGASTASSDMTPGKCATFCASKGFQLAGLEYSQECYCGNSLTNGASLNNPSNSCNMGCGGNPNTICGGPNAITLLQNPSVAPVASSSPSGPSTPTGPVSGTLPAGWTAGQATCIQEVAGRALTGASTTSPSMTISTCIAFCNTGGFQYAAVEYGSECYCGNFLKNGASFSQTSNQCVMPCSGDSTTTCGGPNALQIYTNPTNAPQSFNGFNAQGCIQEVPGRALTGLRVDDANMTVEKCVASCSAAGFTMAGVEYGTECYCGNSFSNGATLSATSGQCYMTCPGNPAEKCGGPDAIQLYTSN